MPVSIIHDPRFAEHNPGRHHPECPERYLSISRALAEAEDMQLHEMSARPAEHREVVPVHHSELLERLEAARGRHAMLDPDTNTSPTSVDAAYLAAGAAIDLATAVAEAKAPPGLALVRPPGHHAMPGKSMGFCLMNNVAAAAQSLLERGLAGRVAIYDWDVHHGNGTQAIFYDDPRVLYMSTHQWPFYPGTGAASETGRADGVGSTVNQPLPEGSGDAELIAVSRQILMPRVRDFQPDMILISAGFDALDSDPVGGFEVSRAGFTELGLLWRQLAEDVCGGRIAGVLEGGYDTTQLGHLVVDLLKAWDT